MVTPQQTIDSLIPGISVFNLALNVAGIINNKKNVALYILNETTGAKTNILERSGWRGTVGNYTNVVFVGNPVIMNAEIKESAKLAEHPLEDGKVRADNKIILPVEISVKIVLPATDYKDFLAKIREYKNNNQPIYVETNFGSYKNMQIVGIPCELNVENVSRITFTLQLKEVLQAPDVSMFTAATVENVSDSNTVNTGLKTGITQDVEIGQNVAIV